MPANAGELIVQLEGSVVQTATLDVDVLTIGRDAESGLVLADHRVSKRHAEIRRSPDEVTITDLGSHNGTILSGTALPPNEPRTLEPGATFQVGPFTLTYQAPNLPPPLVLDGEQIFPQVRLLGPDGKTMRVELLNFGGLVVGRGADCGLRIDSDYVSREHLRIDWNGAAVTVTDLESKNGTHLEGQKLEPKLVYNWDWGQSLKIGTFGLRVERERAAPRIGVSLENESLVLTTNQVTTVPVTLLNLGTTVDHLTLSVEGKGVPATWWKGPAQPVQLNPGARTTVPLIVNVPKVPESRAGVYAVRVRANSRENPAESGLAEGRWTVLPFAATAFALTPAKVSGRRRGTYGIEVRNEGNAPTTYALGASDDEQNLKYEFERESVVLEPGQTDKQKLVARPPRRWTGAPQQRNIKATATPAPGDVAVGQTAQFVHLAIIPPWVVQFVAPLLALVIIFGGLFLLLRPPDIKDFKAEPASTIVGTPVALNWTIERAAGVAIEPATGSEDLKADSGKLNVSPATNTRYTLTARNFIGIQASRSVNVEVKPAPLAPRVLAFSATPERIRKEGDAVVIRWETDGATKVVIEPADEVSDPKLAGEVTVHPSKNNQVYRLTATNAAGKQEVTKTIVIDAPAVASFSASPETVAAGSESRLKWSAQGHTKLTLKASKGEIADGKAEIVLPTDAVDQTVRPLEDTEYTLTATNAGGSDAKTVKVIASPMAIVLFKAEPASISKGEQTQLSWNVTGASSIVVQPGVGAVAPGETSRLVKPDATTEYTLTATGADGKKLEKKATVTVGLAGVKVDVFTSAPAAIAKGESAILNFGVQNAKRIIIANSDGAQIYARDVPAGQASTVGNLNVSPTKTTVYTLTASNDSGQSIASATVVILAPTPTAKPTEPPPAPPKP